MIVVIFQLFFFTMCSLALMESTIRKDERIVTGLSTLLFYSVIGYFVSRIRDMYYKNYARPSTSTVRNYLKWIFRIVIEWLKAAVIIICLREQGLNMKPNFYYNSITFLYYVATEKVFLDTLPNIVAYFNFDCLESLEHLYVPITLYLYTIVSGSGITLYLLTSAHARHAIFSSYFIIYIRIKDLIHNYIKVLNLEKETYASFRIASEKELKNWDDICAVCLNNMSRARITPCNHLFHPQCLKQCLKTSFQCPLCKQDFISSS